MESLSDGASAAEHVGGLVVNGDVAGGGDGDDSKLLLTCAVVTD